MLSIHKNTKPNEINLGGTKIACVVLEDGTRLLTEHGITTAFGSRSGAQKRRKKQGVSAGPPPLPLYVSATNLQPYIDAELREMLQNPVTFIHPRGKQTIQGIKAEALPKVCEVWLKARDADAILDSQLAIAGKADVLMRALAHVGIIALVDEATGFQEIRDRKALDEILQKYLSDHLLEWAKKFPDEFYIQIFRLKKWQWKGRQKNPPQIVGKYTNDIVYDRLAPGIKEELSKRTPRDEKGNAKNKYHQWLTPDFGNPALAQHLHAAVALMRAAPNWSVFMRSLKRAFPKPGESTQLEFDDMAQSS